MSLLDALLEEELLAAKLRPNKLAIRTDGDEDTVVGDGTIENPFNASTAERFNRIVRENRTENVEFRLGPGLFRTFGADPDIVPPDNPLTILDGTRFVGSGMFQTTLKLTSVVLNERRDILSHAGTPQLYAVTQTGSLTWKIR